MRLYLRISALCAALAFPHAARADACVGALDDCQAHPIHFADLEGLFDAIRFDTGFVPAGSPFQLRAAFFLGAGTHVGMAGELVAVHPPSVQLSARGGHEEGMLELDFGFEANVQGRLDLSDLGISETFQIPIPGVPSDLRFFALERFAPFLLGDAAQPVEVEDSIQRFTLVTVDLFDLIAPIPGFDGGLRIDAGGTLAAGYRGERLEVDGVGDLDDQGATLLLPPHLPEGYGGSRDLSVVKHGVLTHRGELILFPTLFVDLFGVEVFETSIASIAVPIASTTTAVEFDPSEVTLLFSDVAAEPRVLEFETVFVGQTSEALVRVTNQGLAPLRWSLPAASGAFLAPRTAGIIAPGASSYVRVVFAPTQAGLVEHELVLTSNDPDTPAVALTLLGEARGIPGIEPGVDGGVADDGGVPEGDGGDWDGGEDDESRVSLPGCGCDAGSRPSIPLTEIALVLGALFARRLGQRRRRASGSELSAR